MMSKPTPQTAEELEKVLDDSTASEFIKVKGSAKDIKWPEPELTLENLRIELQGEKDFGLGVHSELYPKALVLANKIVDDLIEEEYEGDADLYHEDVESGKRLGVFVTQMNEKASWGIRLSKYDKPGALKIWGTKVL